MVKPDQSLNLRGTPCPINFVKAKLALEDMDEGQVLEIVIDEGEPIRNVPAGVEAEGHRILSTEDLGGAFRLLIKKVG